MNKKSDKKHKQKRKQAKNEIKSGGFSFFEKNKNKNEEEEKPLLPKNRLPHQDPNVQPAGMNTIKSVSRCSIL